MTEVDAIEILLVEDNPNDAELALKSLNHCKLANHVHWVKDGAKALDFIFGDGSDTASRPDGGLKFILLDLNLPLVNGREVLKKVRAEERYNSIPVVAMTSSNDDQDIEECYRLGANSHIAKPVDFEKLAKVAAQLGFHWLLIKDAPRG